MPPDFAFFFKLVRENEGLSLRDAQHRSGLKKSTIHKNETEAEVSLNSAVMLLSGYQKSIYDLAKYYNFTVRETKELPHNVDFQYGNLLIELKRPQPKDLTFPPTLTVEDIKKIVIIYQLHPEAIENLLITGFENINRLSFRNSMLSNLSTQDSPKAHSRHAVDATPFSYPNSIKSKQIEDNLLSYNAVLSPDDAIAYLRQKRSEEKLSIKELAETSTASFSVISRMELGQLKEIRLADAIKLNNVLTPDGMLMAVFTRAAEFQTGVIWKKATETEGNSSIPWSKDEIRVCTYMIRICRWFETHKGEEQDWLKYLRKELNTRLLDLKKP